MESSRRDWLALTALALLALIWGYNWVAMKVALEYAPPFPFAALRGIGGGVVLFVVLAVMRKPMRPRAVGWMVLLALTQTTGFAALTSLALSTGHAGKAAILTYTMPFWVLILALPLLHERLNRSRAWAAGFGFAGLVLILSPWANHPDSLSTFYAIGAGFDWALAVVIAKKIPLRGTWELLSLNAWQSLLGGIPLAIIAFTWPGPPIHWTPIFDLALAYNIVLATSLAWFLWLFVLSRLSASQSGLSSLAVPVFGIVAAWLQLGERPGLWESAGVIAIVAGLAALAWSARRPAVSKTT